MNEPTQCHGALTEVTGTSVASAKKKRNSRAFAKRSCKTQTSSRFLFVERKRYRRIERELKVKNERLSRTVDAYKEELRRLKEECYVSQFLEVVADAGEGITKATLLVDQVKNYKRKKPQWSETTIRHCIVMRHPSTKAYEYIRSEKRLSLPCRTSLQKYTGTTSGEVGFSELVRCRLEMEIQALDTPQSQECGLIVDEMRIQEKLMYHKQRDVFVGDVDLGTDLGNLVPTPDNQNFANSLLCFLLCGLHARFKIPVGYFFTKCCSGVQLADIIHHIVKKAGNVGFDIIRVVTDNHKVNVAAMDTLYGGEADIRAPHPADPSKDIFLAFDQSHIIKKYQVAIRGKGFWSEEGSDSSQVCEDSVQDAKTLTCTTNQVSDTETRVPHKHRKNECEDSSVAVFPCSHSSTEVFKRSGRS
ncbi:hypothetical protein HPB49_013837 [Dermacentor silvarum]|uniref:Uncharacterized protein n=1 Tax=Dermacentor silvarum TaxID=543639 RepID=A0ACB8D5E0_DERSI|nr:hypothetical protein HPB49_013837 [Dermacentor silvarum]